MSVTGQDVVYKDIIEPLESASVAVVSTDKASVADYGPLGEVCQPQTLPPPPPPPPLSLPLTRGSCT